MSYAFKNHDSNFETNYERGRRLEDALLNLFESKGAEKTEDLEHWDIRLASGTVIECKWILYPLEVRGKTGQLFPLHKLEAILENPSAYYVLRTEGGNYLLDFNSIRGVYKRFDTVRLKIPSKPLPVWHVYIPYYYFRPLEKGELYNLVN